MELKKTWQRVQNHLYLRDISNNESVLGNNIYVLEVNPDTGELRLNEIAERFEFDFKIYGLEQGFINRFKRTYTNTTGNIGALLNGVKGTGKTITAEILANELALPIILINHPYNGANTFLSSIQQDVCIFIDEYEKVYKGNVGEEWDDDEDKLKNGDSSLLSLMDGTFKTKHRKVFLLTTNKTWINDNMLNRPGRIRYLKQFSDLSRVQIDEILDDCLVEKQFRHDVITFLKPLKIITVDIVKSIVSEVNIHQEAPEACCKDFNLEFKDEVYDIVKIVGKKETVIQEEVPANIVNNFKENSKVRKNANISYGSRYLIAPGLTDDPNNYTVYDGYAGNPKDTFIISFRKQKGWHKSFVV